jgi:excisionase family DNA binding protein
MTEAKENGMNCEVVLLRARDVARMLSVSERTLWRWVSSGSMVEPMRIGGTARWRREDILQWLDTHLRDAVRKLFAKGVEMASVFKRGKDKGKRNAPWYFEYKDAHGKRKMRKGFSDKNLTKQLANKLETEARLRREGLRNGDDDPSDEKGLLLSDHLTAFETSLRARKCTEKHVQTRDVADQASLRGL